MCAFGAHAIKNGLGPVLIRLIEDRVREAYGFHLEREVRLVGEWEKEAGDEQRN